MIEVAETCGFCAGSKRAFEKVIETIEENAGKQVVLFKRLLHNRDVVDSLETKGVVRKDTKEDFKREDIIIIRAHGEPKETVEYLDAHGFAYKDCTCAKVECIHNQILEKYNAGCRIIIIGDKDHPEVIASNSRCNYEGIIIAKSKGGGVTATYKDRDTVLPDILNQEIFVIAQTTYSREDFNEVSALIQEKYKTCRLIIKDSLCDATKKMNESSAELASRCQTMIVIGDKGSANCRELYAICEAACSDTRLIESRVSFYDEIINGKFDFNSKIGITGSASTPRDVIKECKQLLEFKRFYAVTMKKIREKIREYNNILLRDNNPLFKKAVEQFAAIGISEKAKLIRGCLVALGYKITRSHGENYEYSIDLAAAYEIFETAILVHDDVFDKARARRNVTTVHETIAETYLKGHETEHDLICFNASSLAVCIGDLGFFFLNQRILDAYREDKNLAAILSYFNKIVMTTIKGEMLDIVLPLEERLNIPHEEQIEDHVLAIDTLKTAEYTTIGPLCLGLILGGAAGSDLERYEELLKYLGIAFQIQDDRLNIYGDPEQGKPLCNDISEFKMTLLYSETCKNEEMRRELLKYYGKENLSLEDIAAVKEIFEKSGANEKAKRTTTEYFEKCRELAAKIESLNEEDKDILYGFIRFIELRQR